MLDGAGYRCNPCSCTGYRFKYVILLTHPFLPYSIPYLFLLSN
uniref:Uncharacterized protein n=1 Tax=Arundo donax TaxID=35708 RepID=A0A0A9H2C8_ARUDO